MSTVDNKRYRPVLTSSQIQKILTLAKCEQPLSNEGLSLISTLAPFYAKIENSGIQAAYSISPIKAKVGSLESLGEPISHIADADTLTKENYWILCYAKYEDDPALCSLQEIEGAQEHRYLNGLMSDEELRIFELGEGES